MPSTRDPEPPPTEAPPPRLRQRLRRLLVGKPRRVLDPRVFHHLSLVAFLAWVGLGADGLSSSAYGPEEAFKALGEHSYLATVLAVATALTVFIISTAYSRIIEQFPFGGGGYIVTSRLLGMRAGVLSGSALIVDYVLTITTSIAAGGAAVFSFLPPSWAPLKLPVEFLVIGFLAVMNLRGVKESVTVLTPIFLAFLITHAVLIVGAIATRASELPVVAVDVRQGFSTGLATLGAGGLAALFLRAYSMGAGTYTGIEAVSNGLALMREPKVETGKRTMVLMAFSLALTAGGIILSYLLLHVAPVEGKTMNAVLVERFAGGFTLGGVRVGHGFVLLTLIAEALLLFVAAQAGFIAGPRVMANMATDSFLPHRLAQFSERLITQDGVVLMGGASLLALAYTRGDVTHLVVMYSINVFVTFSLSQAAMCRFWLRERQRRPDWARRIRIHAVAFVLCTGILAVNVYEKFMEGGWVTLLVTGSLIGLCFIIRAHYARVWRNLQRLDEILHDLPSHPAPQKQLAPTQPTAVLLVGSYAGLGIHSLLSIQRLFPGHFRNFVFVSIGVVDSATFKDVAGVEEIKQRTEEALRKYVELAWRLGLAADYRYAVGTEVVEEGERLCRQISREFPRSIFFAGKLVFERESWFQRLLHNETAYQLQRRLQFSGLQTVVLPVRVIGPLR